MLRILIVEDDFTSRRLLQLMLAAYGTSDIAVDGVEALQAFDQAHAEKAPYELICLDIMMPKMDGQETLKQMRAKEKAMGIDPQYEAKILMTTCVDSPRSVIEAYYRGGCTSYLVKPIEKNKLLGLLEELDLIPSSQQPAQAEN
ncbi:MAG: response regulator, partial [Desulfuromonadaceae bacterium]|jgi:two-component system, chemotaxis family, chemotaxis protein CheY